MTTTAPKRELGAAHFAHAPAEGRPRRARLRDEFHTHAFRLDPARSSTPIASNAPQDTALNRVQGLESSVEQRILNVTIAKEPGEDHGTRTANVVDTRNGGAREKGHGKLHVGMSGGFAALSFVRHVSTCCQRTRCPRAGTAARLRACNSGRVCSARASIPVQIETELRSALPRRVVRLPLFVGNSPLFQVWVLSVSVKWKVTDCHCLTSTRVCKDAVRIFVEVECMSHCRCLKLCKDVVCRPAWPSHDLLLDLRRWLLRVDSSLRPSPHLGCDPS